MIAARGILITFGSQCGTATPKYVWSASFSGTIQITEHLILATQLSWETTLEASTVCHRCRFEDPVTPPRLTMDLTTDSAIEADGVGEEDLALRRVAIVRKSFVYCGKGWPTKFRQRLLRELQRQAEHISFVALEGLPALPALSSDLPDRELRPMRTRQ